MKMKFKNQIKSITSIVIALIMLMSLLPPGVFAADEAPNNKQYNLNIYIPKNTVSNVAFYPTTGFDDDNRDIFNEEDILSYVVDSDTDKKYDIYTMSCAEGTYSFRAIDTENKSLGGGVIKVPAEAIVDSKEQESNDVVAYLRLSKTYITNEYDGEKAIADDFSVKLFNKYGTVTMGDSFIDEKGYSCYPALIYADGNALLYYVTAAPSDEYAYVNSLKEERNGNIAVYKNDKTQNFKLTLSQKIPYTIIAPEESNVFMYDQILNFNTIKIEPANITDNEDGTCSFEFETAGGSYRVSMEGRRTQAGYIPQNISEDETTLNIIFPDGEKDVQTDEWIGRKESGVLLNINERNKLSLDIGESYKVRAYRAPWQIINTDTDNIMIEPDFHFNILSGENVIDIRQTDSGNAGGNWAEITAKSSGVAVVEVNYDAIDVAWSNKSELYSATNPRRTGVFVVTVGENYGDVSGVSIDAEYYTHYFTGDSGVLKISPDGDDVSVEVANVWQGTLRTWKTIIGNNGVFEVPLTNGNNILKITSDGICDYRVIRASQFKTVITNKTNADRTKTVYPGDEITIGFKGLFQWIPKFSGIYNPSKLYAVYNCGENTIESVKSQYNLPETTIDITVPVDAAGEITLKNGRLTGNSLGSAWSAHRQLTDRGVPANFNASNLPLEDLNLPDLTISVSEPSGDSGSSDTDDNFGDDDSSGSGGGLYEPENDNIDVSNLKFDISGSEADGYVTVSFVDNGIRKSGEIGVTYKTPLGEIIEAVEVPFKEGDTVATVTLRLLKALDIKATYTGKPTNNFYLSSIGNFTLNGKHYTSFGEFDAGAASGWMIKHNNWFINMGASEFEVADGDNVEWLYTCRLGADIGCDWSNPSAEITGIKFKSNYGTLSPSFESDITEYTYSVSSSVSSLCLRAQLENYWARVSYKSGGKEYKAMEAIPVSDGTIITIESLFSEYMGHTPTDTDSVEITVRKSSNDSGVGSGSSVNDETESEKEKKNKTENADNALDVGEKNNFTETTFADINKDDWYYDSVKYVYENGLMQGTGNGFEPESKMSRAMLVTVLYRMAKPENTANTHSFKDVPEGQWYSDAISWAAANGIVSGITSTEFAPDNDISREQMALIIYRFAKMLGFDVTDKSDISGFADTDEISDWAVDALSWANKTKLVNGTSETTLSPKATATRAQVAAILMRFYENVVQ